MPGPYLAAFPKGYFDELCRKERAIDDWFREAATLPLDGVEMYPDFYPAESEETVEAVHAAAVAKGLAVPMLCTSPDFTHPDPEFRRAQVERMARWIRAMAKSPSPNGFRSCRVLSGQNRPKVAEADGIRWTVEGIRALLPTAEAHGVHLVIENHYKDGQWQYAEFAQSLDRFRAIVEQIHSPWFGVNFDPSNALVAGQDPVAVLNEFQDRVLTMHASDRHLKPGYTLADLGGFEGAGYPQALEHGVIGEGLIDYPEIFRILKARGFQGWISIEDGVNGPEDLRRSAAFLRGMFAEYFPAA